MVVLATLAGSSAGCAVSTEEPQEDAAFTEQAAGCLFCWLLGDSDYPDEEVDTGTSPGECDPDTAEDGCECEVSGSCVGRPPKPADALNR